MTEALLTEEQTKDFKERAGLPLEGIYNVQTIDTTAPNGAIVHIVSTFKSAYKAQVVVQYEKNPRGKPTISYETIAGIEGKFMSASFKVSGNEAPATVLRFLKAIEYAVVA
jgi:hypothetical protein